MENALFVNYNPSNNPSLVEIKNKKSDDWAKQKLKELLSLNSIHVCENGPKYDRPDSNENAKGILSKAINEDCNNNIEPHYNVNANTFLRLKDSTKQLLYLLEEIQSKVHTKNIISDETPKISQITELNCQHSELKPVTSVVGDLKILETHTKKLDAIFIRDDHDDCSVYKRLIRKCQCLNHPDYNDFVIYFNEDDKYTTNSIGEIIKNIRILRKFLYIGGCYTKNALMFLYEGLMQSQRNEKLEIVQGCTHADICNVFDEHSIVTTCISWPCKYKHYGNYVTQNLAAGFLYKLAGIEQGRRYLTYNSKITNDIRKVLRKKTSCLEIDIVDSLNATLNLLIPNFTNPYPIACLSKSIYEGIGTTLIKDLFHGRQYMNFDEIYMYLDLLKNCSSSERKNEITEHLPTILILFKQLLLEYNNSKLNIVITSILDNLISKHLLDNDRIETETNRDTATEDFYHMDYDFLLKFKKNSRISNSSELELYLALMKSVYAIEMKNEMCQKPSRKNNIKKMKSNKITLSTSQNKHRQPSKQKGLTMSFRERSSKYISELRKSVIIVPIDKK